MQKIPFSVIEIEHASFHPILKGKLDGVSINLILDTGASRTVIDKKFTNQYTPLANEDQEIFAAGINAQKMEVEQIRLANITIGGVDFYDLVVFSTDLQAVSALYEQMAGIPIDGLLGCDFLESYQAVIDFSKRKISLKNLPSKVESNNIE